jgi:uncharacterized protein (DUF2235 family)
MPKNLILCCDGTNNQFDGYHTNVIRTYKVARRNPEQLTYYDPGVGTMPEPWEKTKLGKRLSMLSGLIFGDGLFDNISDAYKFLVVNYEPGDRIFLFGFSRGAYTARAVAALLHSIGLLHPATECLLPYALNYWQSDFGPQSLGGQTCAEFKATLARPCPVHFIGVWDTVSSVGFINNFRSFPHTAHNPDVTRVRHAVSIDERRSTFRQNLMSPVGDQDVKNVWFAGVHSDVGGGYQPEESGLAKVAFEWMIREASLQLGSRRSRFRSRITPGWGSAKSHRQATPIPSWRLVGRRDASDEALQLGRSQVALALARGRLQPAARCFAKRGPVLRFNSSVGH